ncbi:protein of unknown function [Alteribacillus bidgolensis]|uniref:DUF4181 domain-containing protein n=1 Tax=Alteribacillus bidgolensis TaxID=930129 RepID=A0A1G8MIW3_9BACI|nr:hypothetical protein [Alteribacillus bidgolensis]SDI67250.1 protein of unknown function [Alteribacillus bidgolensis]
MQTASWILLTIVFLLYFTGSQWLKRKFHIADKRKRSRHKLFTGMEITINGLGLAAIFLMSNIAMIPFVLVFLIMFIRGIEELIFHRKEKIYYQYWLRACASILIFLVFHITTDLKWLQ